MRSLGPVVVTAGEADWLAEFAIVAFHQSVALLRLEELLEVASSDKLVKVVDIELLIRSVVGLSESGVNNWVLLAILEILLILKVEQMSKGRLRGSGISDDLLNFLLFASLTLHEVSDCNLTSFWECLGWFLGSAVLVDATISAHGPKTTLGGATVACA